MTIGELLDNTELNEVILESTWEQLEHVIELSKKENH